MFLLFNSPFFLFIFLPITLSAYYLLGMTGLRALPATGLATASLIFYSWSNPTRLLPLIFLSITFNYLLGTALIKRPRTIMLTFAVVSNIIFIGYFKYYGFLGQNMNMIGLPIAVVTIALPIGISFYTFTQIAFLVDAYCGKVRDRSFLRYILFVTYFPHLIAGPILHHAEMMPQFLRRDTYRFNSDTFALGLSWFAFGLFKKVMFADILSSYADVTFGAASQGTALLTRDAWIGALSYALQIYYDFSGYSDMATGLALLMNIKFPINFYSPYKADSIIEFWRRWHMTLSRFLRDYLYIALGGNRKGTLRRHTNLFATMLLGGLWHGASWNFVLWGAIHGTGLIFNHVFREATSRVGITLPKIVAQGLTLLVIVLAWVPFRAVDLQATWIMWSSLLSARSTALPLIADAHNAILWLIGLGGIALVMPNTAQIFDGAAEQGRRVLAWMSTPRWAVACGLCLGIAIASGFSHPSTFLYFRF